MQTMAKRIKDDPQGIRAAVLGLPQSCWKCGRTTMLVAGLRFEEPIDVPEADFNDGFVVFDEDTADILAAILDPRTRRERSIGEIKRRYSRSLDTEYLSNGCIHCDAIQGNVPLCESIGDLYVSHGSEAQAHRNMDVLARIRIPRWVIHELEQRMGSVSRN